MRRRLLFSLAPLLAWRRPAEAAAQAGEAQVRQTVVDFLSAFNDADWPRLREFFAPDATVFFPFVDHPLRADSLATVDPTFRKFFDSVKAQNPGPPYLQNRAEDLYVQMNPQLAVATFHIRSGKNVGRRTLVLNRQGRDWKVVHFHGSNMATA